MARLTSGTGSNKSQPAANSTATALAYVHFSRASDYRRGNPVYRAERDAIRRYARKHGMNIAKTLCDPVQQGVDDLKRCSDLAKLFALSDNGVKVVLVADVTGIAKNPIDRALVLLHLRDRGVDVFDIATERNLTRDIALAEKLLASATSAGRSRSRRRVAALKAKATRWQKRQRAGRRPYGRVDAEIDVLRTVFRLRRKPPGGKRMSWIKVARALNEHKLPAQAGDCWHGKTVYSLVKRHRPDLL